MKKLFLSIIGLGVLAVGYITYSFLSEQIDTANPLQLIPPNAIYILEAEDPIENWKSFSQSTFWTFLKKHPSLAEINEEADYLDTLLNNNRHTFKLLKNRHFYMSAHMKGASDYDFLFLIDLDQASKLNLVSKTIHSLTSDEDYTIRENDYKGYTITDLKDKTDRDHFYLTQVKNYLVCSYTRKLVTTSIDQIEQEDFAMPTSYTQVADELDTDGLARIYLNYSYLDNYLKLYLTDNSSSTKALSRSFSYTGLDLILDKDHATLSGYTSLPDSVELYTKLLQKYGNTRFRFDEVISARTAYLLALGIDDFDEFYQDIVALREKEESAAAYNSIKNKVEKVLGLNLEKDVLAWIGDEIILAQNRPSKLHRNEEDFIVAIKADDIDFAKEKLLLLQKKIKRRTPARFRKLQYKTYPIYYLDIKGFFHVFFGKAFGKLTKPYYTIIDDYVIFSNSPRTLVSTIEDYEDGLVLAKSTEYKAAVDELPSSNTLLVYASGPRAYDALKQNIKESEVADYKKSKPYLTFFKTLALSYTASGTGFENEMYVHFVEDAELVGELPPDRSEKLSSEYLEDYAAKLQSMSDAEVFVLQQINNGKFETYYTGNQQVKILAETKNGRFHGDFIEYYINGNKRSEGTYRKGRKIGRWNYYDDQGTRTEKKWEGL